VSNKIWVINASSLILLGKLGRTDLLESLAQQVIVPQAVFQEVATAASDVATKVHSVQLVGSLGVILRARKAGLIPAARTLIERLIECGSYSINRIGSTGALRSRRIILYLVSSSGHL
jgi:predicted nucleic acid-binding protein